MLACLPIIYASPFSTQFFIKQAFPLSISALFSTTQHSLLFFHLIFRDLHLVMLSKGISSMGIRIRKLVILLLLAFVGFGKSNGTRLLANGLKIDLDPKLQSIIKDEGVGGLKNLRHVYEKQDWPKGEKVVDNILPSGRVLPCARRLRENSKLNPRKVSRSQQQQRVNKKRVLESTPSPGAGH